MRLQYVCACTIVCILYFGLCEAQLLRGALDSLVHSRRLLDAQHLGSVNSSLTYGNVSSCKPRFPFWWPSENLTPVRSLNHIVLQMDSRHTQRSIRRTPMCRPVSVSGMKEWSSLIGSHIIIIWVILLSWRRPFNIMVLGLLCTL